MDDISNTSISVKSRSLVVASDAGDAALYAVLEDAGWGTVVHWRLADIVDRRALPALADTLLIDLCGVPDASAEAIVTRAAAVADDRALPVVALIDPPQIDMAAALLLAAPHQLLCEPSVADILVALVNARSAPNSVGGVASDEAERLRQLNSEVARIAETLARLTRDDVERPRGASVARDRPLGFGMPPIEGAAPVDAREVRNLIRARRMRDNHFAADLFADPAWDMLLDLFAAELEHRHVSVSSLCIAAAVPGTTALRWIGTMIDVGLFERQADPLDRRRAYIRLTPRASEAMAAYFDTVRRTGVAAG